MNLILLFLQMLIVALTAFCSFVMLITLFSNRGRLFTDPKPEKLPSVSIAVPAKNEEKNIAKTLGHLLSLDYPKKPEIIVINDGSTDRTKEIVKRFPVKMIDKKKSEGKPKGLNDALKISKGEIFGFIDAETFITKNALKKLMGYFNNKNVAAVVPAIKVYKPRIFFEKLQNIEYILTILARKLLTFLNCLFVTPGCAFYRSAALKKIGGFDEKNMTEDLEIGLRLHKHGYKIENSINAVAYTTVPKTLKKLTKQRIRWYRGLLYNLKKYKELFFEKSDFGIFLMPLILLGGIIAIMLYFLLLSFVTYDSLYNSWIFLDGFVLSGYDFSMILPQLRFDPNIFFFLTVLFLLMFIVNIYFSKKISRESIIKDIINIIIFVVIYSPLLGVWWLMSVIQELLRTEKKW